MREPRMLLFVLVQTMLAFVPASGQRIADLATSAPVVRSLTMRTALLDMDEPADSVAASASVRAVPFVMIASGQEARRRQWPRFALGGAVLGGGAVALLAIANCDGHCQDDGALAYLPPYMIAGALGGALVGAVVGLIVDAAHHNGP